MSGAPSGSYGDSVRCRIGRIKLSLPSNAIFDTLKTRIEDMTAKATGITSMIERREENCRQLAHKAAFVKDQVLQRMSPPETTDTEAITLLDQFSQALNSIEALMRKQDDPQTPYRQLSHDEIEEQNERLDSILDFRGRLNAHDLRLVALEGRGNRSMLFQLPTDMPLMEMPPSPAVFHGRNELVESIIQRLCEIDNCHIPILGPGGIGKTSVAAAIINDERIVAKYGANRLFMSCEGLTTCDGTANMISAALHLQHDPNARPSVPVYLASLERAILVFDNAETPLDNEDREEVEKWFAIIAAKLASRSSSRCEGLLPPRDDELDALLTTLDGLPLAITLMATLDQAAT
ncbi:hypothetical protein DACRYDRAFT_106768 [Dacryopinax primogenitus]|uniref:Novel STAND NTPase 1 domain-containing protein n=1 Tax=Dacryopinax primogenitus (strain DJM 731) TaxID=1858805 RepID=M5G3B3_DACPD|nr:uncharacterized protein DACRYDRAFT_106768 [Dacryopinax primogenitus]EJU02705.1 hypothetical protein DACRYDRAFT_106768 [Dacryopinax primogenitus]